MMVVVALNLQSFIYLLLWVWICTSYIFSFNHRPFAGAERQGASHWNNRPDKLPWLQDPTTEFKLQCREPAAPSDQRLHPTEAQIATLPHYCDPLLKLGRSENQVVYADPYNAKDFYFEEPKKVKKPMAQHLERSFINCDMFHFAMKN